MKNDRLVKIAAAIFLAGSLFYVAAFSVGGTSAYFSDVEVSQQNKFHTGMNFAPTITNVSAGYYDIGDAHTTTSTSGEIGTTMSIKWEAIDSEKSQLTIDLWLSIDDGASWFRLPTPSGPARNLPNTGEFIWRIPEDEMESSDWCRIKVVATEQDATGFTSLKSEGISNRFCYQSSSQTTEASQPTK